MCCCTGGKHLLDSFKHLFTTGRRSCKGFPIPTASWTSLSPKSINLKFFWSPFILFQMVCLFLLVGPNLDYYTINPYLPHWRRQHHHQHSSICHLLPINFRRYCTFFTRKTLTSWSPPSPSINPLAAFKENVRIFLHYSIWSSQPHAHWTLYLWTLFLHITGSPSIASIIWETTYNSHLFGL